MSDVTEPNLEWTQIVAERKIKEAIDAGEFDNVPGMGEPVDLTVDPFTPVHLRIANKVLKNARALPEWLQLEKEIQQETLAVPAGRERGLKAILFAKNAASRERAVEKLRGDHHERMDTLNTLILKYNFVAPVTAQQPFRSFNIKREMVTLEEDIAATLASIQEREKTPDQPKLRQRRRFLW
ncbi:MAG: DUF1992 domain-containing protein [Armatimonadota bacterium]